MAQKPLYSRDPTESRGGRGGDRGRPSCKRQEDRSDYHCRVQEGSPRRQRGDVLTGAPSEAVVVDEVVAPGRTLDGLRRARCRGSVVNDAPAPPRVMPVCQGPGVAEESQGPVGLIVVRGGRRQPVTVDVDGPVVPPVTDAEAVGPGPLSIPYTGRVWGEGWGRRPVRDEGVGNSTLGGRMYTDLTRSRVG